jgi:hypothetical protein
MRLLGYVIILLIMIIGSGIWVNHALESSTDDLVMQIDKTAIPIKENDWQSAVDQTETLEEEWKKEAKWWPVFLEHQEMDNIEFAMAKFKEYVASKDSSLSLGQLSEMRIMIEHLPKKEEINIKNVL